MWEENRNTRASVKNNGYVNTYDLIDPKTRTDSTARKNGIKTSSSKLDSKEMQLNSSMVNSLKKKVNEVANKVDNIVTKFVKNDNEYEQVMQAVEIKEAIESASNTSKSKSELLAEEIEKNYQIFVALLPMSAVLLESIGMESIPLSAAGLLNKWKYSLSLGNCKELLQKLNGFMLEDIADETASLKKWMDFLGESGIKQLDSAADRIIISTENRANYQNGYEFKDGVECLVKQHPWIYQDILICPGMLMKEAEAYGNGS